MVQQTNDAGGPINGLELENGEGVENPYVRLEKLAVEAAQSHQNVLPGKQTGRKPSLIDYLDDYETLIQVSIHYFRGLSDEEMILSSAAEWMLDNQYIVRQALREIHEDLPSSYYQELPKLASGPLAGLPRTFGIARELVLFEKGNLDLNRAHHFLKIYQEVVPLKMGELWSIPILLRLVAIQALAGALVRILQKAGETPPNLPVIDFDGDIHEDEVVAHSILSLRVLAVEDWKEFFESLSLVETILRRDPAGLYAGMDFETRDRYRKVVESIAERAGKAEPEVAEAAIHLARQGSLAEPAFHAERASDGRALPPAAGRRKSEEGQEGPSGVAETAKEPESGIWDEFQAPRQAHVGTYLIGEGRGALEQEAGYVRRGYARLTRWAFANPTLVYLGGIAFGTAVLTGLVAEYTLLAGGSFWAVAAVIILALVPAASLTINLINWLATRLVKPRVLPKMDFSKGIPDEARTLVVIPSMLSSDEEVDSLLQQLELHFLRNRDRNLCFALATDVVDARQETMPEDEVLVRRAQDGIRALNEKYAAYDRRPFFLFHRPRLWNPAEGVWMGWERKRGKLNELNRWLRGDQTTSINTFAGPLEELGHIRYIITLDADTILPPGAGSRLVAALAHPLNRAVLGTQNGSCTGESVTAGYTILQPRTEIIPSQVNRSRFLRIFSGDTGLDLYTLAVSDVYQDLFGEGIYTGKGIYDLDAFEKSLFHRVPENALLSHDLFEGIHGRVGLASDITLIEDFPPNYLVFASRMHRWMRGDWQLLPWLFPQVPGEKGRLSNCFSTISRWKILDNLRRSLLSPAVFLLLLAGWTFLPGPAWAWTLIGLTALGGSLLTSLFNSLLSLFQGEGLRSALQPVGDALLRWLLAVVFLPYEAFLAANAIWLTLTRLSLGVRLLQWTTAAQATQIFGLAPGLIDTGLKMLAALILVILATMAIVVANPQALLPAAPLLVAWLLSPAIAYWISLPVKVEVELLSEAAQTELRLLSRRTWLFFERFVGPEDHWLPPDHYQEAPKGVVAHRTSPTNIGLGLLSTLGAYDLGYIDLLSLVARLQSSLEGLEQLERYRGHVLNWFDTRSLHPLPPRYVSMVDSGNLAASLLALRQGVLRMGDEPVWRWELWEGGLDSLALLVDLLEQLKLGSEAEAVIARLHEIREQVLAVKDQPQSWPSAIRHVLGTVIPDMEERIANLVETYAMEIGAQNLRALRLYARSTRSQMQSLRRIVQLLMPWLLAFEQAPAFLTRSNSPDRQALWQALLEAGPVDLRLGDIDAAARSVGALLDRLEAELRAVREKLEVEQAIAWCEALREELQPAQFAAKTLLIGFGDLAQRCETLVEEMDFRFLYDSERKVFHIGYNLELGRLDANYYDLLASEARIGSLVAIAKGDVPVEHWLHLARPLTQLEGTRALLSWSATLFEYLMPLLLMRSVEGTLLHQTANAVTDYQILYANMKDTPWGISESGYYRFDSNQNYQYRAFGVPGLGYKRGLGEDLVISPYASILALPLRPQAVVDNIQALKGYPMLGVFGLHEAIDFTPRRMTLGRSFEIVRSYMAHHQGMILLSLANYFTGDRMVERFHADPRVMSVDLLLQEQIPANVPTEQPQGEGEAVSQPQQPQVVARPWPMPVQTPQPRVHFLSNGRYGVLLDNLGGGYSTWKEKDLTRWRPDLALNNWGSWVYIQDMEQGTLWSASFQPTRVEPNSQDVSFSVQEVEYRRQDGDISLVMEITVSPEDDLEVRRITLTNQGDQTRRLRLVSYGEVVMAPMAADLRHPAFNKLFIESEYVRELNTLVFRRRPRSAEEDPFFMGHALVLEPGLAPTGAHETSRLNFLGRGGTVHEPELLQKEWELTGTTGATLDPIFSLGQEVELEGHRSIQLTYLTLAGESRQAILDLVSRYSAAHIIQRAFDQARTQAELELRRLGMNTPDLALAENLLSLLMYAQPLLRAPAEILATNSLGQPGLWPYAISGDYPILLVKINSQDDLALVSEVLQAHAFWRSRQLMIDVVIMSELGSGYSQELTGSLHRLISKMEAEAWLNRRGGIFIVTRDRMAPAEATLLETAARVVLNGDHTLREQLEVIHQLPARLPAFSVPSRPEANPEEEPHLSRPEGLLFDNGLGGFSPDGREYVIYLEAGQHTPAPWSNVIANPEFGFLVTEAGMGFSWAENSGENRLTPWSNDPVSDPPGEALYLRDEETGEVWSPMPLPAPGQGPYLIRHGAGYTCYEHYSQGLKQHLRVYAAVDAPLKVIRLRLENTRSSVRRITVTYYAEWVLGVNPATSRPFVIPEYEPETQALMACNPYNHEFTGRVAFAAASQPLHGLTADRIEFLGRRGDLQKPAGLTRIGLAGSVAAGLDPCAALQIHLDLQPGEVQEVHFLLGQGKDRETSLDLVRQYKDPAQALAAWEAVEQHWDRLLGSVQVDTPDPAMNVMLNRWLLYQALSCRIWGRSAFYQSSGAYGFRDQLQDVMALVFSAPELIREQILRAARHQFEAGDVLHWWHPPSGRGVRTRISDDLLWLPYVTAYYVFSTGDTGILDEQLPFKKGPLLDPGEEERYAEYETSSEQASLYEHCRRSIEHGMTSGPHGLPLIGSGDWNDGMSRVGIEGRGESVWLAWFLYDTLQAFAGLSRLRGDEDQAAYYLDRANGLRKAVEESSWDGQWYRRAYYDDGAPLGSAQSKECKIDSIAQSWSVLSGAGDPQRARQAMESVDRWLVREDDGLLLLFTPPFDKTPRDPGYIKGYLPGIRENGGQYTHAAIWAVWAFADLGMGERAFDLFSLLNPVLHADNPEKAWRYQVEPYVVAADVYSVAPHTGRGGWTWYTGSSGWLYRLGVEAILGLRKQKDALVFDPCIPPEWKGFRLQVREGENIYQVQVENPQGISRGVRRVLLDGEEISDGRIPLLQQGSVHQVRVILGDKDS